jgi:hypothetical protein
MYRAEVPATGGARPATLPAAEVARLNGGRLPIGVGSSASYPVTYRAARTLSVWLDVRTERVVDLVWSERVTATVAGRYPLPTPVVEARQALPAAAATGALDTARTAGAQLDRRGVLQALAVWCGVLAGLALLAAVGFAVAGRRSVTEVAPARPKEALASS